MKPKEELKKSFEKNVIHGYALKLELWKNKNKYHISQCTNKLHFHTICFTPKAKHTKFSNISIAIHRGNAVCVVGWPPTFKK